MGDLSSFLGSGRSPEKGMATHSSFLAWRIPWTEKLGWLQFMGLHLSTAPKSLQLTMYHLPADLGLQCRRPRFDPWVKKIPWRRERLPSPVFLPGELHGQINLVGYSPWGRKESDTTKTFTLKGMATHSSFLAWRIPWTEEVGRL